MRKFARNAGLLIAFLSSTAWSVEVDEISVVKNGKSFITDAVFLVEAPRDTVVRAITDFDRLSDLNPAVLSSSADVRDNGDIRVTTKLRDCVAFFCRSVELVEDVRIDEAGNLHSQIVPKLSDFASGDAIWQFETVGAKTRVRYRSRVRPKIWLPPMLGTTAFRHALRRQIKVAANSIETLTSPGPLGDSRPYANVGGDPD